jgi:hypothetical protein
MVPADSLAGSETAMQFRYVVELQRSAHRATDLSPN